MIGMPSVEWIYNQSQLVSEGLWGSYSIQHCWKSAHFVVDKKTENINANPSKYCFENCLEDVQQDLGYNLIWRLPEDRGILEETSRGRYSLYHLSQNSRHHSIISRNSVRKIRNMLLQDSQQNVVVVESHLIQRINGITKAHHGPRVW